MLKTYGERLRHALNEKGISQTELCRRTGINKAKISSYINDKYKPKQDAIYLISQALGINELWLMGLSDEMVSQPTNTQWGDDKANQDYLSKNPDLLALYNEIKDRQDIYILFDKTKDLDPKDVESFLLFVQTIRKARGFDE